MTAAFPWNLRLSTLNSPDVPPIHVPHQELVPYRTVVLVPREVRMLKSIDPTIWNEAIINFGLPTFFEIQPTSETGPV